MRHRSRSSTIDKQEIFYCNLFSLLCAKFRKIALFVDFYLSCIMSPQLLSCLIFYISLQVLLMKLLLLAEKVLTLVFL
jgi:hypothetical protein